ncbi:hypothetical protein J437_LFUL003983 [Ladona fulva]|uniref:OTU domain-containing protein n=1 Tax=Ladona fulva TaxID=123851 RepID=A0A8K0K2R9_LADFU|nr:hypothetical protein J437_LFUL003983 [Ladona fulva]
MQNPWEWGGELEMSVMSFMYRRDFLIFREIGVPPFEGTSNGFKDKILLCYLQNNQYDSVYPKEHIKVAAFCQSIVYHTLYERVFKLEETDYAVNKMLHDKSVRLRRDSCIAQLNAYTQVRKQLLSNANGKYEVKIEDLPIESKLSEEWYNNAKEILLHGIIPFPYKVAKALDPDIYRNIEFDVWNEMRKELRWGICSSMYPGDSGELRVGSKCLVRLESLPGKELHAHIQEMSHGKGPVLVYIEELAQK